MKYINLGVKLSNEDEIKYDAFTFPGGERNIILEKGADKITIGAHIDSSERIMDLVLMVDALRQLNREVEINLFMPYIPYARQDRVVNMGEPLSVKVMADMINALNLHRVIVFHPHSDVAPSLLNNVEIVDNFEFFRRTILQIFPTSEPIVLVAPDAGAQKNVYSIAKRLTDTVDQEVQIVLGSKRREPKTGKILEFGLDDSANQGGKRCLIIDDICDGGGTFMGIAKKLRDNKFEEVHLAVSHGIFSRGVFPLTEQLSSMSTTDSLNTEHQESVYFKKYALRDMISVKQAVDPASRKELSTNANYDLG